MKYLFNTFYFIFGLALILAFSELYISLSEIENPGLNEPDTVIGRKRTPNLKYTMFTEGFSMGEFNTYSYLGPGYGFNKEENIFRIALLGDSYVEGFQVFDRLHFRKIIEKKLNQNFSDSVQVLNFGRSGFDLADMYVYYKKFVASFNPDITMFLISNSDLECKQTDPVIPRLEISGDSVIIKPVYKKENDLLVKLYCIIKNSRVLQMVNNSRKLVLKGYLLPKLLDKFYVQEAENIQSNINPMPHRINNKSEKIAKSLSLESNGSIWFVSRDKVTLNDVFVGDLSKNDIVFINLNDTINELRSRNINFQYWPATKKSGHWNYQAHNAVGNYLANKIIKSLN